ncbi:MAG: hypothetical protein DRQ65_03530 [Gammaproteobacteria bacterium]|nr:MAG: hypothetical protein DRQ98_09855 [Gammaproteobacteria bacterium]RLA56092.1 MAG: hypothetical protein DRQ65_03530 [Gammaproteobacteria bacterium]
MVNEFQFIAVLIAIIFGLSLMHVLSSTACAVFASAEFRYGPTCMAWTGFVILILLLNWCLSF